jgi:hypothetical protein
VNTDTDNAVAEVITIKYRGGCDECRGQHAGSYPRQPARFDWDGGSVTDAADPNRIVEPQLQIGKTVLAYNG